jgi:mannose/fructose/N-acetylgalactosamine-specific phosphotransferase system component IID
MAPDGSKEGVSGGGRLARGIAAAMLLRSFFLQSVWNARGMQNVGFCFAMLPLLGPRGGDAEARRGFLTRHLGFFNTNPALASYAIGAAASAEIAGDPEGAVDTKRTLGGALGMAGDSLFWGSLRPLAALIGVVLAVGGRSWAALALVLVYNAPHLYFRVRGIVSGAARGAAAASEVVGPGFRRAVALVRAAAAFVAGLVLALAAADGGRIDPARGAIAAALFALALVAARLRIPATVIGLAAAAGGVVLAVLGTGGGPS